MPLFDKLLILDIDETLLYSTVSPLDRPSEIRIFDYFTYLRPGLDTFLTTCAAWFTLAVWTSAAELYAREVISKIFPQDIEACAILIAYIRFVSSGSRCAPAESRDFAATRRRPRIASTHDQAIAC